MAYAKKTKKELTDILKAVQLDCNRAELRTTALRSENENLRQQIQEARRETELANQKTSAANAQLKTLRFLWEKDQETLKHFRQALDSFVKIQRGEASLSAKKDRAIEALSQTADPIALCPRCSAVSPSTTQEVLLCRKCLGL